MEGLEDIVYLDVHGLELFGHGCQLFAGRAVIFGGWGLTRSGTSLFVFPVEAIAAEHELLAVWLEGDIATLAAFIAIRIETVFLVEARLVEFIEPTVIVRGLVLEIATFRFKTIAAQDRFFAVWAEWDFTTGLALAADGLKHRAVFTWTAISPFVKGTRTSELFWAVPALALWTWGIWHREFA